MSAELLIAGGRAGRRASLPSLGELRIPHASMHRCWRPETPGAPPAHCTLPCRGVEGQPPVAMEGPAGEKPYGTPCMTARLHIEGSLLHVLLQADPLPQQASSRGARAQRGAAWLDRALLASHGGSGLRSARHVLQGGTFDIVSTLDFYIQVAKWPKR